MKPAEASIGRGGSDRDWYYGCQVVLAVADDGLITGFVLAPAATEERWAAECLLCWRNAPLAEPWTAADMLAVHDRRGGYVGPTGPIWPREGVGGDTPCRYLSDRGLAGVDWAAHWQRDYHAVVVTPRDYALEHDELPLREHASRRQVIETINAVLSHTLHLAFPRARTLSGLLTRVAAKLAACNLAIRLNRTLGRPDLAIGTLFPG